ncbi:muscarinic Acetylcholine Receptor, A-type [Haemaphysalis longicornis]
MGLLEAAVNASVQFAATEAGGGGGGAFDEPPGNGSSNDSLASEGSGYTPPYSLPEVILIAFLAGLLSVITIIGNLMVMISFKLDKQLQTISNYFLLSLAIADFSIGVISMPLFTMYTLYDHWPLGTFICDTWLAFDYLTSNASVLNLLIISFDRYFSVTRPLTYRARRTTKRAAIMIASAWVISLVLWPPWIYSWPYIEGRRSVPVDRCYIQFLETNIYVTFGTALAAFYVPVTVMCILYWRIWRETEKRQKDLTQLQAGRKDTGGSQKSTSSDDPAESEDFRRGRSDSCPPEVETTYVPTSLCVETSKYLPPVAPKRRRLRDVLLSWCRIDNDKEDDDSTSHGGSPGTQTPASVETPVQSASMTFRADQLVQLNPAGRTGTGSAVSSVAAGVSIPMTDRNGLRRNEKAATVAATPASRSYSSDSVYTILIRLPTQPSLEGETSQASIKMILEEEAEKLEAAGGTSGAAAAAFARTASEDSMAAMRTGDSGLETIRIPLNTKLVHRQVVAKQRAAPKKKRKQQERKQEKKAAKTLSAILLAFIVTWTPYNVLVLIKTVSSCDDCIPTGLWNFVYYLCYINSTVNPLCYALCNANFRRTYMRILSCKWHNKQRSMNRGYFS